MEASRSGHPASAARGIVIGMMALIGCLLFIAFFMEDVLGSEALSWSNQPWPLVFRYVVAMAIGGALAGFLTTGLFGRRGILGWILAALGGLFAAFIAGLFGSLAGQVPDLLASGWSSTGMVSVAFGALIAPLAFVGQPMILVGWLVLVALTHLWVRRSRSSVATVAISV